MFEVYQDANNKWRFRLKAANGEIIAVGEAYETKQGCLNGIQAVISESKKENIKTLSE